MQKQTCMNHSPPKDIGSRQAQRQDRPEGLHRKPSGDCSNSRTIAIKDFELSHQTALEAVRMAISSRSAALSAAQQYIAGVVAQGWTTGVQSASAAHAAEVQKLSAAYQAYS